MKVIKKILHCYTLLQTDKLNIVIRTAFGRFFYALECGNVLVEKVLELLLVRPRYR